MAEQTALVGVLQDESILDALSLTPEHFASDVHRALWRSVLALREGGEPVDAVTVKLLMARHFVDRPTDLTRANHYLDVLTARAEKSVVRGDVLLSAARDVRTYATVRSLAGSAGELVQLAASNEPRAIECGRAIGLLSSGDDSLAGSRTWEDNLEASFEVLVARQEGRGPLGIDMGLPTLDKIHLFQPGTLLLAGARTSVGKTVFGLMAALCATSKGKPTLIVSTEMSGENLADRAYSVVSGVDARRIVNGFLTQDEMSRVWQAKEQMRDWPLDIMDSGKRDIEAIKARARSLKMRLGIGLLVIDYIQAIPVLIKRGYTHAQAIGDLTKALKALAQELQCPVLCLAQLNRQSDLLGKRPTLLALKDSGDLEQDADVVFLFSPELQGMAFDDWRVLEARPTLLDVAKNRMTGECLDIHLVYKSSRVLFREAAAEEGVAS
jgi:replicative DNA helicase